MRPAIDSNRADDIRFDLFLDRETFAALQVLAQRQNSGIGGLLRDLAKSAIARAKARARQS
jgi:hypothetical protein